jgi:LmbE family N-acetylglucosaminyl deacetylase
MTRAVALLNRLTNGIAASALTVIVVAHPDDETISLGGSLGLFLAASIVQLTDGAPADPEYRSAHRDDLDAYRTMRLVERRRAFNEAGWTIPVTECGAPDQQAHAHLPSIIDTLTLRLTGALVVFTHPYEGGHPDHDAAAFAVQAACDRLTSTGQRAPERVEFASYHWNGQRRVHGRFWPDGSVKEFSVRLAGERLDRKRLAVEAYASQHSMMRKFALAEERYRMAPRYDFTQAPPTPGCVYDRNQWPVTSADLRAAMARAS